MNTASFHIYLIVFNEHHDVAFSVAARGTDHLKVKRMKRHLRVMHEPSIQGLLDSYHLWQNQFVEELFELPRGAVVGEFVEQPAQVLALHVCGSEGNEKVVACLSKKVTQQ